MEIIDPENQKKESETFNQWAGENRRGKIFGGLIIVAAGCVFLAREMGVSFPSWIFTWQMFLIMAGLYVGLKHAFQNIAWLIMIMVGTAFLLRDYYEDYDFTHYLWPIVLILVGIYVIFKPRKNLQNRFWRKQYHHRYKAMQNDYQTSASGDEYTEISAVFGSVNRNIISKNFKGGEINSVFGSTEVNFSQADFNGSVKLEVNSVFGGTRLIIPPHWEVKSELTAVFGNVEDKRPVYKDRPSDGSKILILEGNAVFGGVEIQSY